MDVMMGTDMMVDDDDDKGGGCDDDKCNDYSDASDDALSAFSYPLYGSAMILVGGPGVESCNCTGSEQSSLQRYTCAQISFKDGQRSQ